MIREIIHAISIGLNGAFGDGYRIYTDDVTQAIREPCFFIEIVGSARKPLPCGRYSEKHSFELRYFPSDGGGKAEMCSAAERMTDALELIALENGDLLRGTDMHYEPTPEALHFFVGYGVHVRKPGKAPRMKSLSVRPGLKPTL